MKNLLTSKRQLSHIYKANQCTDISDVDNAIEECKRVIHILETDNKSTKAAYKRLISLEKRRKHVK